MPKKALMIQLRRIGDAVLVTPAIDALRALWPEAELHLLTEPPCHELFAEDDRLRSVMVRPSGPRMLGLFNRLRRMRFDVVFDFQSLPVTAALAAAGTETVGFARRFRRYRTTVRLTDHAGTDYAADHKLDLLRARGLSPALVPARLRMSLSDRGQWDAHAGRPKIALSPVSPWAHKRWEPEAFARTARRVHEASGAAIKIVGGPGEDDQVQAVSACMKTVPHETVLFTSIRDLAGFLAGADLFLGNDNGPRHMALALGLPTLGYFNEVNPTHWTPPDPRHPVLWDPARGKRPAGEGRIVLTPDPVIAADAALKLLEAGDRSGVSLQEAR